MLPLSPAYSASCFAARLAENINNPKRENTWIKVDLPGALPEEFKASAGEFVQRFIPVAADEFAVEPGAYALTLPIGAPRFGQYSATLGG